MKKTILNILLIITVIPFLTQCASQSDVEELRYQLRIVNKKLEDMKSTTFGQLQKRQAASAGQMDELESKILELKGQLEETGHSNRRLKEHNKELEQSIDAVAATEATKREELLHQVEEEQKRKELELHQLNEQLRIQNENLKAIQEARIRDAELKAQAAKRAAEAAKVKARTASTVKVTGYSTPHITADKKKIKYKRAASTGTASPAVSARSSSSGATGSQKSTSGSSPAVSTGKTDASANKMARAQKLFDKKNFNGAFDLFEQLATGPSSGNSVTARYMMGECLFNQKEYDKAIMQYQKIISQHPGNVKAPTAMFRQGVAFEKLSDKETARVIYKKIIKRHGASPEAAKAKEKLNKL